MKLTIYPIALGISFFFTNTINAQDKADTTKESFHIGFVYPVSNHGNNAKSYTNKFSFNVLAGVSKAETGFTFAGISNIIKENASGFQFAGLTNHIGKNASGFQFAGLANTYESSRGFQFAGLTNISRKEADGFQFAGFLNKAGSMHGAQFAGFMNLSGNQKGPQIAGFYNKARDIKGVQFAGFMNMARKVDGVQIAGLINIADSSDCPIALINIIKTGEKSIGINTDETLSTFVTFRSGGRVLYGIFGLGYNFNNSDAVYGFEGGFGAHLISANNFRVNVEGASIILTEFKEGDYLKVALRILPSYKFSKRFELYAGPTLNYINTNTLEGQTLVDHYIWDDSSSDNFKGIYIGYTGGIQFHF